MKEAYIPISEEDEFKVPTFIQVCKPQNKRKRAVGVSSYVTLVRTDDFDAIFQYASKYNEKFNIDCSDEDLKETIKLALDRTDFYFIKNKQDNIIGLFRIGIERFSLKGTEFDDMPVLTIPNVMMMEDSPISLDIIVSMSSEIIFKIKEKYFPNTLFINFEFCGTAYYNQLYFKFISMYALWGNRHYDIANCGLLCHIYDIKRKLDNPVLYYIDKCPEPQDITNYKKNIKSLLKRLNLDIKPITKTTIVKLDALLIISDLCKKHKFETFTVPINKIKGLKYGLVNDEAPKLYKAGKQSVPIFIDDKFNVVWGNDLYEYILSKGAATIDCVLVDDIVLRELQQGYLCAVITDLVDKPFKEIIGKFTFDMLTPRDKASFEDEADFIDNFKSVNVTKKYKSTAIPEGKRLIEDFYTYITEGKKSDLLTIVDKFADCNFHGYFIDEAYETDE